MTNLSLTSDVHGNFFFVNWLGSPCQCTPITGSCDTWQIVNLLLTAASSGFVVRTRALGGVFILRIQLLFWCGKSNYPVNILAFVCQGSWRKTSRVNGLHGARLQCDKMWGPFRCIFLGCILVFFKALLEAQNIIRKNINKKWPAPDFKKLSGLW